MKITGAFLAEAARTVDGKLDVQGGFVRGFLIGADRVVVLTLVVLAVFEPHDTAPTLALELVTPTGEAQTQYVKVPDTARAQTAGFAFWQLWLPAELDGSYELIVKGDSGAVSLPLNVVSATDER